MPNAPDIPQPPSFRQQFRGMFQVRSASLGRWRFALRAGTCMGAPILAGWLAGDVASGMMAATGGFTALYGSDRPYANRARELAAIALAFALVVGLGLAAAAQGAVAVVVVVSLIAMVATWMGNAFQIGPPGAYMFLLASAAASGMHAAPGGPLHSALLVLAGGAFAWCVHMLGALFDPRGPEKAAVRRAGDAVVAYVEAFGSSGRARAGHAAARALHGAWSTLVSYQPRHAAPGGRLTALRAINRRLHALFGDAMSSAGSDEAPAAGIVDKVRALQAQARALVRADQLPPGVVPGVVPLGHPGAFAVLMEALRPGALSRTVVLRVGMAALLAGWLGAQFHLERSYWAVAAAVLMLHQGFDWNRTVVRSIERLLGTWVGLLLGGTIIVLYPQGIWLVLAVMGLQFSVEMLVMRNYALAVLFITSAALLLASWGAGRRRARAKCSATTARSTCAPTCGCWPTARSRASRRPRSGRCRRCWSASCAACTTACRASPRGRCQAEGRTSRTRSSGRARRMPSAVCTKGRWIRTGFRTIASSRASSSSMGSSRPSAA